MFLSELRDSKTLSANFDVVLPPKLNRRDQTLYFYFKNQDFRAQDLRFDEEVMKEILLVVGEGGKSPVGDGDIIAVQVGSFMVASFHGDTNGLASIPVVRAVQRVASKRVTSRFGLDANTHREEQKSKVCPRFETCTRI